MHVLAAQPVCVCVGIANGGHTTDDDDDGDDR